MLAEFPFADVDDFTQVDGIKIFCQLVGFDIFQQVNYLFVARLLLEKFEHEGRLGIDSYWVAGTIANVFFKLKRRPQNLIHDRDPLFKGQVMRMCSVADIKELRVPPQYPVMNCYAERVIQSIKFQMIHHIKCYDGKELQKYLD